MVGIICSSPSQWYYIHGSRMYITYKKLNSRYFSVVKNILGGKTLKSFYSKLLKTKYRSFGNKATII